MMDLHCHSRYSDGTLTPDELVRRAMDEGVTALALTDHDTMEGLDEFTASAKLAGIRPVPGVEVSAEYPDAVLHLLGYYANPGHPALKDALNKIRNGRNIRNREILGKLEALGMPIPLAEVEALSGEGVMGRPHIARAMIAKGYVKGMDEVFGKYLARGGLAYAERYRCEPEEILRMIHAAGGVVSLAHPGLMRLSSVARVRLMDRLCAAGLDAVEVYYPDHNPTVQRKWEEIADRRGLISTGGSDFHGPGIGWRRLGHSGAAPLDIPTDTIARMEARAREWRQKAMH